MGEDPRGNGRERFPWWYQVVESFVVRVGFPAAVAAFVLIRLDQRLSELTDAINKLSAYVYAMNR